MTQEELKVVLELHKKWLHFEVGGVRADLRKENLYGADMRGADMRGADMRVANMRKADMRGADMRGADIYGADVCGAKNIPFIQYACPEKGEFVAFKKCSGYIVKLLIPADAKRSSATTRKCRASYAKVLSITTLSGEPVETNSITNTAYSPNVVYKVGEFVYPDEFDDNRWNECSHGISFFINRQEAVEY